MPKNSIRGAYVNVCDSSYSVTRAGTIRNAAASVTVLPHVRLRMRSLHG